MSRAVPPGMLGHLLSHQFGRLTGDDPVAHPVRMHRTVGDDTDRIKRLVGELQLRLRIKFRLRTPTGVELIPDTELLQQRDVSYNETIALSKEGEEALLFRNMQTDLVQQLLRRLAAAKPPV